MAGKSPAIISLEEFTESINMVLYGDTGVGKTVLAGSAPKALFIGIETGTISAKRQGSSADLWPVKHWNDLVEAYDWLEANPGAYEWVLIDSATDMQALCMRGILDAAKAENSSRDEDIPALQDWQKYYNMFFRFVAAFNDLPINVLWIARTMRADDEDGEELVLPDIQGKGYHNAQRFCAMMGVVAYYKATVDGKGEDATVSRKLLFKSFPPYFAKDRYSVFPRWVTVTEGDEQKTTMNGIARRIMEPPVRPSNTARKVAPAKKAPAKKAAPARRRPNQ